MIKLLKVVVALAVAVSGPFAAADVTTLEQCERSLAAAHVVYVNPDSLSEVVSQVVRFYRSWGGTLYWQARKLKTAYAFTIDRAALYDDAEDFGTLGKRLRILLLEQRSHLSQESIYQIEGALEDYSRYELPALNSADKAY
ncbi:MAG: hypothetical protein KF799_06580 [Bdellovibrionales bacterium]|nr:hypothetical protein [Bdellovibrionales bacterium]